MTFDDIYKQFIKPTKENFPIKYCVNQNKNESNVFESDIPFLCLVIDRRFDYQWNLIILYPYICRENDSLVTFGWIDRHGSIYCNIENSTQLWDEFVVGFREYDDNPNYKKLWDMFIEKIESQYEN